MYDTLVDNSIYTYKILEDILVDNMNGPVDNLLVKKRRRSIYRPSFNVTCPVYNLSVNSVMDTYTRRERQTTVHSKSILPHKSAAVPS